MIENYLGFVYIWINKVNGKKYIGLHFGQIDDGYIGSGVAFKRAIKKYGIDQFERKILYYEVKSEENLYKKEFEIINEMNAVFSTEFYNITNFDPKGSHFINGKRHRLISEETKKKISKANEGKKHTKKTRKKMSKSRMGKKLSEEVKMNMSMAFKGRKVSEETKKKISKAHKGKKHTEESKKKMSISRKGVPSPLKGRKGYTQGEKNGMSGKSWYNNGNISKPYIPGEEPHGWILGSLNGLSGEKNGFFGKKHTKETKNQIRQTKLENGTLLFGKNNPASKSCVINGKNFDSIKEASDFFEIPYRTFYRKYKRGTLFNENS
jgi:hypothetical protein